MTFLILVPIHIEPDQGKKIFRSCSSTWDASSTIAGILPPHPPPLSHTLLPTVKQLSGPGGDLATRQQQQQQRGVSPEFSECPCCFVRPPTFCPSPVNTPHLTSLLSAAAFPLTIQSSTIIFNIQSSEYFLDFVEVRSDCCGNGRFEFVLSAGVGLKNTVNAAGRGRNYSLLQKPVYDYLNFVVSR